MAIKGILNISSFDRKFSYLTFFLKKLAVPYLGTVPHYVVVRVDCIYISLYCELFTVLENKVAWKFRFHGNFLGSAKWATESVKSSASAVNWALDQIRAKYYFTSVLIFGIVFFAAYNATMSLQYWLNPDIELEELHAYLVSATNQLKGRKFSTSITHLMA